MRDYFNIDANNPAMCLTQASRLLAGLRHPALLGYPAARVRPWEPPAAARASAHPRAWLAGHRKVLCRKHWRPGQVRHVSGRHAV